MSNRSIASASVGDVTRSLSEQGCFLRVVVHGQKTRDILIRNSGELLVGRAEDWRADSTGLFLEDRAASRRHAKVRWDEWGVTVEDQGSTHGTFVNGYRLPGVYELLPGDDIGIGDSELQFRITARSNPDAAPFDSLLSREQVSEILADVHRSTAAIVHDVRMAHVFWRLKKFATGSIPVLIGGESGVGKEFAALAVRKWSPRSQRPFRTVNCASFHEDLIESELFGHVKGAFTTALNNRDGLFKMADGGTLFLDEIATLSLAAQAKLLRVIENGIFTPVGSTTEFKVDIRIIAATKEDLCALVREKKFRDDLYYRLNGGSIVLPPLRQRVREIPILAEHFLAKACSAMKKDALKISPEAHHLLQMQSWPGNVRELSRFMERVAALTPGMVVSRQDILRELRTSAGADHVVVPSSAEIKPGIASPRADNFPMEGFDEAIDQKKRELILQALKHTDGNKSEAARTLGIARKRLYEYLDKLGLSAEDEPG